MSFTDRISRQVPLNDAERKCLLSLENGPVKIFFPGEDLFVSGERCRCAWLIRKGWATLHEVLPNGSCQIFCFLLPGDVVQLPNAFFASLGGNPYGTHSDSASGARASALTEVHAVRLDLDELRYLYHHHPELMTKLLTIVAMDTWNTTSRHMVNIGRRSARERLANLFIELWERQQSDTLPGDQSFSLPVSQTVLADALGLTPVHISRVMTQLTGEGIISSQKRSRAVKIHDLEALFDIAGVPYLEETPALAADAQKGWAAVRP